MNAEEIRLRMGLDASSLKSGSEAVLQDQKKKAMEYVAFWKKAADDREAIETRSAVEQAARNNKAAALWRKREQDRVEATKQAELEIQEAQAKTAYQNNPQRLQQKAASQAAINAEIAAGSGGWGWRKDTSAKKQGGASGMVVGGAATSAASSLAAGESAGGALKNAGWFIGLSAAAVKIEHWVNGIISEGSFTKGLKGVGGSFKKLGSTIAEYGLAIAKGIGVIALLTEAYLIAASAIKMGKAATVEGQTIADLHRQTISLKDRLLKELEMKFSLGQIGKAEYNALNYKLNSGTNNSDIRRIQNRFLQLNEIYDPGEKAEEINTKAGQRKANADKELNTLIHGKRDEAQIQSALNSGTAIQAKLEADIAVLKSKQALTADENITLVEKEAELSEQMLQNAKDKEALKEKELETQKEALRVVEEQNKASQEIADLENQKARHNDRFSTIEEIAGRNFAKNLNQRYGQGGRFDLGTGNGRGGQAARDFMEAEKRQLYDRQFARDHYEAGGEEVDPSVLGAKFVSRASILGADQSRMKQARSAMESTGVQAGDSQLAAIDAKLETLNATLDRLNTLATGDGLHTKLTAD